LNVARGSATRLLDLNVVQVLFTPGFLVYVQADGAMYAVPFDDRALALTGTPVQIATGVSLTGTGLAQFAVAGNGTVVYIPEEPRTLVRVARDGSRRALTEERKNFHAPRFSPDGRSLSMDFNTTDGRDVWVLDLTGGALTRTTFDLDGHDATWTPDGRFLTYLTNRGPALGVFRVRPGSTEPPDSLLVSSAVTYTGLWLPDGSTLITVGNSLAGATGSDLAIIRDSGRGPVEPLVATRFQEAFPAPSPDGRWLAYSSNLSGRDEVYLRPLTGDGDQVQVSLEGGVEPVWSRDGSELFYRSGVGDGSMFLVARVTGTVIPTVTTRQVLFPVADIIGAIPHANYDVAPDGRSFVMVQQNPASRIMVIQNLPGLVERLSGSDIR